MAGDWIKVEHTLPDKPEVDQLAEELAIDHDAVVGKLVRVWVWVDQHSSDGNIKVTAASIDRRAYCPGFAEALRKVGWLEGRDGALSFPHFDRHNGQSAKARVETNRRVAEHRQRARDCNALAVTSPLPEPLPEKRREERIEREKGAGAKFPSSADVLAHGNTRTPPAEQSFSEWWWETMEGAGWTSKGEPVHPARWKNVFNAAHQAAVHNSHERRARNGHSPPPLKRREDFI